MIVPDAAADADPEAAHTPEIRPAASEPPETQVPPAPDWAEDVLGPDYQALTLRLGQDEEGDVVATLVRHRPPSPEPVRPIRAILYIHGWSDYFFQTPLAEFWSNQGAAFYAVDLRNYGRSMRPGRTAGYIEDLASYDNEIEAALAVIHHDLGTHASIMLMAHSTGGLTGVLWADRNPGRLAGIVLNSPWLELLGSSVARTVSAPAIMQLARFQPRAALPNIDQGFYARSLRDSEVAASSRNPQWRPTPSFPVRAGWLRAIISGHAAVAKGLSIDVPILMLLSSQSAISARWSDEMNSADSVLDVDAIARRTSHLGRVVTLARVPGGLHDLTLSAPGPRARFYAEISRWTAAYGWS